MQVVRHVVPARGLDLAPQHRVLLRIEAVVARALAVHAGLQDRLEVLLVDLRAGDERGDLLLLDHLPVDELLDVGMVGVDDHHLGGAARGAARLDGAGRAVADLEEAHQAGRLAAAGEPLAFAAQPREVRAGAGAVFEQPRLAHPQIHDPAFVDEIVVDRLDEAGVRLRMLVGGLRLGELAGLEVDVEMALARAVDAVGPEQAGVEPLRRVRRRHLHREHVDELVEERAGVLFGVEIAALPAPIGPGAGEPLEHLLRRNARRRALLLGQRLQRLLVGDRAPQPGRNGLFLDLLQPRGHARLAEIFLRQHVGGDLRPGRGHLDVVGAEHHRAVGIADLARGQPERDVRVGGLSCLGVSPFDPHPLPLCRWRGSLRGSPTYISRRHVTADARPATPWPQAALGLLVQVFSVLTPRRPGPLAGLGFVCGTSAARSSLEATQSLSPAPVWAIGAVTQTPFRRAPGGTSNHSRRTHSSYDGPFRSSRLSMAPVKKLLNVVGSCEIRGRLRCNAASIGYRNRIRKALIHSRVTRVSWNRCQGINLRMGPSRTSVPTRANSGRNGNHATGDPRRAAVTGFAVADSHSHAPVPRQTPCPGRAPGSARCAARG